MIEDHPRDEVGCLRSLPTDRIAGEPTDVGSAWTTGGQGAPLHSAEASMLTMWAITLHHPGYLLVNEKNLQEESVRFSTTKPCFGKVLDSSTVTLLHIPLLVCLHKPLRRSKSENSLKVGC